MSKLVSKTKFYIKVKQFTIEVKLRELFSNISLEIIKQLNLMKWIYIEQLFLIKQCANIIFAYKNYRLNLFPEIIIIV